MIKDLVIGSVVIVAVKDKEFKIMITSKDLYFDKDNKIDYTGVVYPYGYVEGEEIVYFNKELIREVIHFEEKDEAVIFYENLVKNLNEEIDDK